MICVSHITRTPLGGLVNSSGGGGKKKQLSTGASSTFCLSHLILSSKTALFKIRCCGTSLAALVWWQSSACRQMCGEIVNSFVESREVQKPPWFNDRIAQIGVGDVFVEMRTCWRRSRGLLVGEMERSQEEKKDLVKRRLGQD